MQPSCFLKTLETTLNECQRPTPECLQKNEKTLVIHRFEKIMNSVKRKYRKYNYFWTSLRKKKLCLCKACQRIDKCMKEVRLNI